MEKKLFKLSKMLEVFFGVLNGRFNGRRLKPQYMGVWRFFAWGTFIWLLSVVAIPLFEMWDVVVRFLNCLIWG